MRKLKFLFTIGLTASVYGCKSTQEYRNITDAELPDYKAEISNYKAGEYSPEWIQPINKTVKCEFLMEGYQPVLDYPQVEWDGECKDGKAEGLGKLTTNGSVTHYEVTYHNKGITDQYFYKWVEGTNSVSYGVYVRENNQMVKKLSNEARVKLDGEIENVYAMGQQDLVSGTWKGVAFWHYTDGAAKYIGERGNNLFFGTREAYDSNNQRTYAYGGFYNVDIDKPEKFVLFSNNVGVWHQEYHLGMLKEQVQLPQSFIYSVMQVTNDATKLSNDANQAAQYALAMKKKYDATHEKIAPNNGERPSVKEESNPKSLKVISTGTGFFVSNDGYFLTNSHVINGASKLSIVLNGKSVPAILIDQDSSNDVALLKVEIPVIGLPIELKKKTKQGAEIAVLGYPNIGLQGNEQKATFGFINANSGVQGDTRYFQISSPIQPGNSGSPMLNESGVVVGIASASLNQDAALRSTGTLAQNVNYAVKIPYALPMLISHGVEYIEPTEQAVLAKTDLIESISASVVLVVAEK